MNTLNKFIYSNTTTIMYIILMLFIYLIVYCFREKLFDIVKFLTLQYSRIVLFVLDRNYEQYWDQVENLYFKIPQALIDMKKLSEIEAILEIQLQEQLKNYSTGAILLIQNTSDPSSTIMRSGLYGRFSHSAIYLQPDFVCPSSEWAGKPLLWQAAGEKQTVQEYGYKTDGPDLHLMSRFLTYYLTKYPNSRFVLRNIREPLSNIQNTLLKTFINKMIMETRIEFCTNFQLFYIYVTSELKSLHFLDSVFIVNTQRSLLTFCSKLVTDTYKCIGLLPKDTDSTTKNPNFYAKPYSNDIFSNTEVELHFIYT